MYSQRTKYVLADHCLVHLPRVGGCLVATHSSLGLNHLLQSHIALTTEH